MTSIFFSPWGTTKKTARAILGHQEKVLERDLLGRPLTEEWTLPAGEPVLVSMPVYAGRIPGICREMLLAHLKGHGNPAIAVAVYGNRDYDDALVELQDLLEENGFCVIAGAAFVAQHSIFTKVAAGRPDEDDRRRMAEFGAMCREKLSGFDPDAHTPIHIKGNRPYKKAKGVPFQPECNQNCMKCYACAKNCPTHSIPLDTPWLPVLTPASPAAPVSICAPRRPEAIEVPFSKWPPRGLKPCAQSAGSLSSFSKHLRR